MRISDDLALALATMLAGCGSAEPPEAALPTERVACATGGAALARDCSVERSVIDGGTLLTIRHPDGGFRRLVATPDGQYRAADGAVPAQVSPRENGSVEVRIADARYSLPAHGSPPARP